jgi:hypothetical protein
MGLNTPKAAPNASGERPVGGRKTQRLAGKTESGEARNRTGDTTIFRQSRKPR